MHKARPHRGFTLVETLIVVVILAIAAAVIVPQLTSRSDLRVAAAGRRLIADISYAQSRTILTQKRHYVVFTSTGYSIVSPPSGLGLPSVIAHPTSPEPYAVTVDSGFTISPVDFDGKASVGFDSLGSPLAYDTSANQASALIRAGTVKLTCGTAEMIVTVEPYTGELSVKTN